MLPQLVIPAISSRSVPNVSRGFLKIAMLYLLVLLVFPIPYYLSHLDPGFRHPVDPLLVILACSTFARRIPRRRTAVPVREEIGELVLG